MLHVPGICNRAADATSRNPGGKAERLILPDDIAATQTIDTSSKPLQCVTWERIREATTNELHQLHDFI